MNPEAEALPLLLVEDSPADIYLVREAMRQEGLKVDLEVAEDGAGRSKSWTRWTRARRGERRSFCCWISMSRGVPEMKCWSGSAAARAAGASRW